jgi:hypothetical protein
MNAMPPLAARRHLVCYAAGPVVHAANQARLVRSARQFGFDSVHAFGEASLDAAFKSRHATLLAAAEGAGYWLWKPYLILEVMKASAPGDVIVYVDSGAFLRRSPDPLWQQALDADLILFENDYPSDAYTKRDAFVLTGTDAPEHHGARQLDACFLLVRNRPPALRFVEQWLDLCCDERILADGKSRAGLPDLPGFVAHRHDQAVLTLLLSRERAQVAHVLHPRWLKHRFLVHHRRRTAAVPIWLWHFFHDGAHAWWRRLRQR